MTKRQETGRFVGFQFDITDNMHAVRAKAKPGKPLIRASTTSIEKAAQAYIDEEEPPDPLEVVWPEAVSTVLGSVLHRTILATHLLRDSWPKGPQHYEQRYLENIARTAPKLMPNLQEDTARDIFAVLYDRRCAMPYTTNDNFRHEREYIYYLVATGLLNQAQQNYPWTANYPLSPDILPIPSPKKFAEAWELQNGKNRLFELVGRVFVDHERNPFRLRNFNVRQLLIDVSEWRLFTRVGNIIFSMVSDHTRFTAQVDNGTGRPPWLISETDFKSAKKPKQPLPEPVDSALTFVRGQILASAPRNLPTKRTALEVEDALKKYHPKTAYTLTLRGYGSERPWETVYGDDTRPIVDNPTDLWRRKQGFEDLVHFLADKFPWVFKK